MVHNKPIRGINWAGTEHKAVTVGAKTTSLSTDRWTAKNRCDSAEYTTVGQHRVQNSHHYSDKITEFTFIPIHTHTTFTTVSLSQELYGFQARDR